MSPPHFAHDSEKNRPGVAGPQNFWWDLSGKAALILLILATQWPSLNEPWRRDLQGINGAFFGLQARNLSRIPADQTLLGGVLNTGEPGDDPPVFYLHHPPLLVWVLTLSQRVFGESEWVARLPILVAFIGCTLLVLSLGKRWLGRPVGWAAACLFVLLPAASAFGMHVDVHGPLTLLPALGIMEAWDRIRTGARHGHFLMMLWLMLGVLTDWPICYLPLILWLHAVGTRAGRDQTLSLFMHGVLAAVILALVLTHIAIAQGGLNALFDQLAHRTFHLKDDHAAAFGPVDWMMKEGSHLRLLFSIPVLILSLLWLGMELRHQRRSWGVLILLIFGSLDVLLGFQASYVHDAWSIFLWPGIVLSAAGMLWRFFADKPTLIPWAALIAIILWLRVDGSNRISTHQIDEWYGYSCLEMAAVIQAESHPSEAVIVPGQWDCAPALYYYADRTMAPFVFDDASFQQALTGSGFFGPLGFAVKSQKPVVAVVLPTQTEKEMTDSGLIRAMTDHGWERTIRGQFLVYRRPSPPQ